MVIGASLDAGWFPIINIMDVPAAAVSTNIATVRSADGYVWTNSHALTPKRIVAESCSRRAAAAAAAVPVAGCSILRTRRGANRWQVR